MSYGKEFTINNQTFLIEKNDNYYYIAKKIDTDNYQSLCEGELEDILCSFDVEKILKISDYDSSLYSVLITFLNDKGFINSYLNYKKQIREMILSGISKEDILSSSSDARNIYRSCFPLDVDLLELNLDLFEFEPITKSILDELTKIVFQDVLKKHRIEHLKNQWKDYQKIDLLILKFNEVAISNFQSKQTMYIKNIDLITQFVGFLNTAGYNNYYNPLENGGYILNINL